MIKVKYLFLIIITFFAGYLLLTLVKSSPSKNIPEKSLKEKYPYISYPIGCQGATEQEYSKRKANSSGYHEPEIYTATYLNKWDKNTNKQQFNIISEIEYQDWVQKYPLKNNTKKLGSYIFPFKAQIKNYIEKIDTRRVEIDVYGSGYFFLENRQTVTLSSRYLFTDSAAKNGAACFDDKKRILNIGTDGYTYRGNAGKVYGDLKFSTLTPQYCSVFSFLDSSEDIFLVCLSEKISPSKYKILVLGYSKGKIESENSVDKLTTLIPVLKQEIVENYDLASFSSTNPTNINIILGNSGNYYLFSGTQIFEIFKQDDGYLVFNSVDIPNPSKWTNITYPNQYVKEDYDLPYLFMSTIGNTVSPGYIFDLSSGKFLNVDYESCVAKSPEKFFNPTVDPFSAGPYKSMQYKQISPNHIKIDQYSSNSGCSTYEGKIDVYINGDNASCSIKIIGDISC